MGQYLVEAFHAGYCMTACACRFMFAA
jgi:hypothetical protein